ncbi:MAG: HDOD domain-containing protein [Pseudomonadota bacterium]
MDILKRILQMVTSSETELPTLSVVVDNILKAASDETTATHTLADIIAYDQGVTNKLLQLANSVYYAQRTQVDTIQRAISVIGFDEIIGITLGMSVLSAFAEKHNGLGLDLKAMWIHSIGVATAAKEIAEKTQPEVAKKVFIPGLLHDMGKVILSIYFKPEYKQVRESAIENKKPLYRVESEFLSLDHAMLSGLLMKRWQFPDAILLPCRFHHNPQACPGVFKTHALIVNLADYVTHKAGIGHSGNPSPVTVKHSMDTLGTTAPVLRLIIEKLVAKEDEIKEFFRITT